MVFDVNMKCNGTENTVEAEQPPSSAGNDVPCDKGSNSATGTPQLGSNNQVNNGSNNGPGAQDNNANHHVPSPHPKPSPNLNDSLGQLQDNGQDNKIEPKLEPSRPSSTSCPDGPPNQGQDQWNNVSGMQNQPTKPEGYPPSSTPGGTPIHHSNVSNGPPHSHASSQQHNQVFVFTTVMANQAAEAVLTGHFPSIVAFHCSQPGTRRMLEQRRAAMLGQMGGPWPGPGGPGMSPHGNQSGYPGMPNFPPQGHFPGHNGPPFGPGGNPRGMSPMPGPQGPMGSNSPMGASSPMGGSPMGPGGQMMGPGGPMGPNGPPPGPGRPLPGVKVPDENLTPQQRQHREEQLATLRKMQQWLFPDQQQGGGPGGPPSGPGGPRMMPPQCGPGQMGGPGNYGPMGAPKGPRGGQYNPRQGGPPPPAGQYNFRHPDQPRPMSPAILSPHHAHSPYHLGGQSPGPDSNSQGATSGGPGNNSMQGVPPSDMPGGMMSSPQHMSFGHMDGPNGPNNGNDMMSNDPLASLDNFDSNNSMGSQPGGNGSMGIPSPGPVGRMGGPGPGGQPYMGPGGPGPMGGGPRGRANVQVRPDAPNTIQYLPARPQGQQGQPPNQPLQQRPPSLEFLQRYTRPQDMNMKGMSPGGPMGGPGMPAGGPMGPGGPMGNGPMGPGGPMGMPMGGPGGPPMGNGPGQGMQYYPDGPPPGQGGPMPPYGNAPQGGQNKPFYGGPTTADPNYAAQFHNFQQQLYATNTAKGLK